MGFFISVYLYREEKRLSSSQKKWSLFQGQPFDDASLGALQVLTSTANWLYTDMGYTKAGKPTTVNLYQPDVNVYFAMAYIDWIMSTAKRKGINPTEQYVVMSYNGGLGANNSMTRNHYNKYLNVEIV